MGIDRDTKKQLSFNTAATDSSAIVIVLGYLDYTVIPSIPAVLSGICIQKPHSGSHSCTQQRWNVRK
jgi:hypothetical protein